MTSDSENTPKAERTRTHFRTLLPERETRSTSSTLLGGRRQLRVAAILAGLFLIVLGTSVHFKVRSEHQNILSGQLQALLNASVKALTQWMDDQKEHAQAMAVDSSLRRSVLEHLALLGSSEDSNREIASTPTYPALQEALSEAVRDAHTGAAVIDSSGHLVALNARTELSATTDALGTRLSSEGMATLGALIERDEAIIVRPYEKGIMLSSTERDTDTASMSVWAPIASDSGEFAAALVFVIDPGRDFTDFVTVSRAGDSGDSYAFDANGWLLSESRFDGDLRQHGLIPEDPDSSSVFRVRVADPGGNLMAGFEPEEPLNERPLTRMAAAAVAKNRGIDVDGYRDYRGVEVIGAWDWITDPGFGLAVEIDREEAYRPLLPLTRGSWLLFGLLAVASGWILLSSRSVLKLRQAVRKAERYGQYTLVEKIGEGGMGEVWKASHALLKRPTVIKLLKQDVVSEETERRFETEVQLTSQLTHPNTIAIYDFGHTPEGTFFYAMEFLPGVTLESLIEKDGQQPTGRVIHILKQICGSLEEAHGKGLIHRDIKPLNIMLTERGGQLDVAKVLDFGLVKDTSRSDIAATALDQMSGTPLYVAPERLRDPTRNDARTDIYSVGVIAFELLTGIPVHAANDVAEALAKALTETPRRLSEIDGVVVPQALDDLVASCLDKDPDGRPRSARELNDALDRLEGFDPWTPADIDTWWKTFLKDTGADVLG